MKLPSIFRKIQQKLKDMQKPNLKPYLVPAIVLLISVLLYFAVPKIGAKFPAQYEHVLNTKAKLCYILGYMWGYVCYPFQLLHQSIKKCFIVIYKLLCQAFGALTSYFRNLFNGIAGLFKKIFGKVVMSFASIVPYLMKAMNHVLRFFVLLFTTIRKGLLRIYYALKSAFGVVDGIYMKIFGKPLMFLFKVLSTCLLGLVDIMFFYPLFLVKSIVKVVFGFLFPMNDNMFKFFNNICNDSSPCEIIQKERFTKIIQEINEQLNITKEILGLMKNN